MEAEGRRRVADRIRATRRKQAEPRLRPAQPQSIRRHLRQSRPPRKYKTRVTKAFCPSTAARAFIGWSQKFAAAQEPFPRLYRSVAQFDTPSHLSRVRNLI